MSLFNAASCASSRSVKKFSLLKRLLAEFRLRPAMLLLEFSSGLGSKSLEGLRVSSMCGDRDRLRPYGSVGNVCRLAAKQEQKGSIHAYIRSIGVQGNFIEVIIYQVLTYRCQAFCAIVFHTMLADAFEKHPVPKHTIQENVLSSKPS